MAIGIIIAIALGAFNTIAIQAAVRNAFPASQTFSLGVSYSFADSSGSLLLPGGTGNVTLTITSALGKPSTLYLSFNATDPTDWSGPQQGGGCCVGQVGPYNRDLTMTLSGTMIIPENSDTVAAYQGLTGSCSYCIIPNRVAVQVLPGQNTYLAQIAVSATSKLSSVFVINWFATPP